MSIPDLKGRIVFISGAASGIGLATAEAFAEAGCTIVASDLREAALQQVRGSVEAAGAAFHCLAFDVADEAAFEAAAADISSRIGTPDVVINNAGIAVHGSLLNVPTEAVHRLMDVNFYGVLYGCRAFLPRMLAAGGNRHLVNIASLASIQAMPNMSAYAASKYAVDGLTEALAIELDGTPVDVSCIHPGIINTPIARGDTYNKDDDPSKIGQVAEYYRQHGSSPRVVADGIVRAVRNGKAHLYVGAQAPATAFLKRLSPALTRKLAKQMARKIGVA